jgi:hypothetical protein
MPRDLTWWEAADYARAGFPVRREIWQNPIIWITHPILGVYHRHEEMNQALPEPAAADPVAHVVRNTEFGAAEFLTPDWTTLPPGGVDPPLPPGDPQPPKPPGPDGNPPPPPNPPPPDTDGGGPGGYPPPNPNDDGGGGGGGDDGGGGVVLPPLPPTNPQPPPPPDPPPKPPPPTVTLPNLGGSAITAISISASMSGIVAGTAWSVVASSDDGTWSLGVFSADGSHDISTVPQPATGGSTMFFVATCIDGPQTLRGTKVGAFTIVSD